MERAESPYTGWTEESFLVVAVAEACVTVCDITLSHHSALRFDSEEQQKGFSGHVPSLRLEDIKDCESKALV